MYPIELVDTLDLLDLCLDDIASPLVFKLAIDLEGIDLSRNGTVTLLQIFSNISTTVWVIDIFLLGEEAFSHITPRGKSLKAVLENRQTMKVTNHWQGATHNAFLILSFLFFSFGGEPDVLGREERFGRVVQFVRDQPPNRVRPTAFGGCIQTIAE